MRGRCGEKRQRRENTTLGRRVQRGSAEDRAESQTLDGVLEFLDESTAGDLRAGSVLSDEVYVLQFSYRSGVIGAVFALCRGGLSGDSWAPGVVSSGACRVGRGIRGARGYRLYRRRDA